MKYRNPYAPLRFYQGAELARVACPTWRMVVVAMGATLAGPPAWGERDASGTFTWHDGEPPAQTGVVCDSEWTPVEISTRTGRRLPRLGSEWTEEANP